MSEEEKEAFEILEAVGIKCDGIDIYKTIKNLKKNKRKKRKKLKHVRRKLRKRLRNLRMKKPELWMMKVVGYLYL